MTNQKERQGDFVFTAQEVGEYRVCFNNEMSTFQEKMVDFEIAVRLGALSSVPPSRGLAHLHLALYPPSSPKTHRILFRQMPRLTHVAPDLQVENEPRTQLPSKKGSSPEQTSVLEESIFKLSGQLSTINRNQKYFRTRENRNFSTVRSTEKRIFNFSVVESALMICMAGLQVFIVRFFFQGARKGEFFRSLGFARFSGKGG